MPSRADMDRPATVTAAALGIVLIAVSVPFLGSTGGGATEYLIAWTQETAGSASQPNAGQNTDATVRLTVQGRHPSNATIEFNPCNDGAAAPLQQPATITWSLREDNRTLRENQQASCANRGPFAVELHPHPDIGSAEGENATAAAESAERHSGVYTYTLTFRYTRPTAPGGLPLPTPAFSATGNLEVQAWHAIANLPEEGSR